MTYYKKDSIIENLKDHCGFSKDSDFLEVTDWSNCEGIDVSISSRTDQMFSLTWGEWSCLKKVIKKLNKISVDTNTNEI